MKMYCLTNDRDVSEQNALELSLEEALGEVDGFPSLEQWEGADYQSPFLGFVNDQDEVVQFHMREGDSWEMDMPIVDRESGRAPLTLNVYVSTRDVKELVDSFFRGSSSIDSLLALQRQLPSVEDDIEAKLSVEKSVLAEDPNLHVVHADYLLVDQHGRVVCDVRLLEPDRAASLLSAITSDTGLTVIGVDRAIQSQKQKTAASASSRTQRS